MGILMKITAGVILKPKFDEHVEYVIIRDVHLNKDMKKVYEISTIESRNEAIMTEEEINRYYDVVDIYPKDMK